MSIGMEYLIEWKIGQSPNLASLLQHRQRRHPRLRLPLVDCCQEGRQGRPLQLPPRLPLPRCGCCRRRQPTALPFLQQCCCANAPGGCCQCMPIEMGHAAIATW
ncbi:hypothetical protein AAC387_Pa12g0310 [Persea americana]